MPEYFPVEGGQGIEQHVIHISFPLSGRVHSFLPRAGGAIFSSYWFSG